MLPVLFRFEFGGHLVTVGSYATFMTLAWIEMVAVGTLIAARRGLPWRRVFGGAARGRWPAASWARVCWISRLQGGCVPTACPRR